AITPAKNPNESQPEPVTSILKSFISDNKVMCVEGPTTIANMIQDVCTPPPSFYLDWSFGMPINNAGEIDVELTSGQDIWFTASSRFAVPPPESALEIQSAPPSGSTQGHDSADITESTHENVLSVDIESAEDVSPLLDKPKEVNDRLDFNIHVAGDDICGKGTKDSENPIFIPAVSLIPEDACKDYTHERIQQVDFCQICDLYFNAERFSASACLGEVPPMDVEAMDAFVDGYSNFLPRLTLFTLAQQKDYCYKLLKLNRLKAAKLSLLLEKVTDHRDLLITQIEDLKKQVTIGTISFSEEIERLHRQLTLSQESTAAAELSRDEAMRARELAEQAQSAVDTSFAREAANLIEIQELVASPKKKIDDLNADVIKQTNLAKNYRLLLRKLRWRHGLYETKLAKLGIKMHTLLYEKRP
ncbi:hypothetical protein C5167_003041, partial [Papaver somniferum]